MNNKLSHFDEAGQARMVDVSDKSNTLRMAKAEAFVVLSQSVINALPDNPKGDPLEVARIGEGSKDHASERVSGGSAEASP